MKHAGSFKFFDPPCCCFGRTLDQPKLKRSNWAVGNESSLSLCRCMLARGCLDLQLDVLKLKF